MEKFSGGCVARERIPILITDANLRVAGGSLDARPKKITVGWPAGRL